MSVVGGAPWGSTQQGFYLFCLTKHTALEAVSGPGLDDRCELGHFEYRDVVAVLGTVALEEFVGPGADERLQDPEWIGPRAWRHEEVVERVMGLSPVLPARFGTLFSSLDSLQGLLARHYEAIMGFLEFVSDKEEWAVKGWLERERLEQRLLAASQCAPEMTSSGARYLLGQRCRAAAAKDAREWLRDAIPAIGRELRGGAIDFLPRAPRGREISGTTQEMVFNWALLVRSKERERLRAAVGRTTAKHAEHGLTLEATGPWPPYSFCPSLGQRETAAEG